MPTPDHHLSVAVQAGGIVVAIVATLFSPAAWAGFIGAAFGVAFSNPLSYKQGLLWLAFGVAVSLASNAWLVHKLGDFGAGIAFFTALISVMFRQDIFGVIQKIIRKKGE